MNVQTEKRFAVEVIYNGVEKPFEVEPEERVSALLQKAIAAFGVVQNPHLLGLFRQDGTAVPDNESIERAGLKPQEILLLRPDVVRGGARVRLAPEVIGATFEVFRECGRGESECVLYWTGPSNEPLVDGVIHPVHKRSPFGYTIASGWLTDFWKDLAKARRSVKAQVHTHPGEAFHSATDDQWPIVSQVGFLSIVIPDFATGEIGMGRAWVGRLCEDGAWQQLRSADDVLVLQ